MENKYCKSCSLNKAVDIFYNSKSLKDGKDSYCIDCRKQKRKARIAQEREYQKNYRALNKEKRDKNNKTFRENNPKYFSDWRSKNKDLCAFYSRDYCGKNKEKIRLQQNLRYRTSPHRYRKYASDYSARKMKATPNWLSTTQKNDILSVYELARDCSLTSGLDYEVDHIVPLRGKDVCGLHVPWNLQVLPTYVNRFKSNKF